MPGLYISDGGATSSALGSALGGIAQNLSPQAYMQAQALRYEIESRDIANQAASEALQGRDWATTQAGAALGQAGAQPPAPGAPSTPGAQPSDGSSVANTVAGVAQPPGPPPLVGAYRHPAGTVLSTNPYTSQVQNWILTGQATPEAWKTSIVPLGQTMAGGPGSDYTTQTEIAKARLTPYKTVTGETMHFPGLTAPQPDVAVSGGSTIEQQNLEAAGKEAQADAAAGPHAADAIGQLTALQELRNTVAQGHVSPNDKIYMAAARKADAIFGTNIFSQLNNPIDVMTTIKTRMKAITAATKAAYAGDPSLRGLSAQLDESLPDPESDLFDTSVAALKQTLGTQVADADAANQVLKPGMPASALGNYSAEKLARHKAAADAVTKALQPSGGGGGGQHWIFNPKTGRVEPAPQ